MPAVSATHPGLVALEAPTKLDPNAALPSKIVMLKWGDNETAEGNFRIGPKTLAASALWDDLGYGEVAIDFNHNTVPGHPSYKGEPAPIAAMAALSVVENVGLVFDAIQWTPEGQANKTNYRDLSPTVARDESGEVIFCHSGALCRNGATKGLHLFPADTLSSDITDTISTLNAQLFTLMAKETAAPTHTVKTPSVHKPGTFMINTDLLKQILKLPADATADDLNAALDALAKGTAGGGGDEPDAGADTADTATVKALSAQIAALGKGIKILTGNFEGQVAALNARFEAGERKAVVDAATAEGKIVPAEWLPGQDGKGGLPIEQLRTLCATLPEIVPLSARTPANIKTVQGKEVLTAVDREVMRTMGISEDAWKKHNGN
jgi:phage I-like protein